MEGFKVGNEAGNSVIVSHDTYILGGWKITSVELESQSYDLGSHIGTAYEHLKNHHLPAVPNLKELSNVVCCNVGSFPTTYLGLSLGARYKSKEIRNGVIEKFENRLASWKMQYLSFGGSLALIKGVLDSIPTYFKTLFSIPNKVQMKHQLRRDFSWEGSKRVINFIWLNVKELSYQRSMEDWVWKIWHFTTRVC